MASLYGCRAKWTSCFFVFLPLLPILRILLLLLLALLLALLLVFLFFVLHYFFSSTLSLFPLSRITLTIFSFCTFIHSWNFNLYIYFYILLVTLGSSGRFDNHKHSELFFAESNRTPSRICIVLASVRRKCRAVAETYLPYDILVQAYARDLASVRRKLRAVTPRLRFMSNNVKH